jgi:hypothetical protein
MYKNVIPMVQGLAYQPEQNPLQTISQAYGMWNGAMQYDPTGSLMTAALRNAFLTGAIGAGVGHVLPGFTLKEGAKWGALLGLVQTVFYRATASSGEKQ